MLSGTLGDWNWAVSEGVYSICALAGDEREIETTRTARGKIFLKIIFDSGFGVNMKT